MPPPDTGSGTRKRKPRFDAQFHEFICKVTESSTFNGAIMFTIFLNALGMAFETDFTLKSRYVDMFVLLDEIFIAIYMVEMVMKVYAEPTNYWKSSYNLFDFLVLAISLVQTTLYKFDVGEQGLAALRILRALRTFRTLRTVSFIRGLQVMLCDAQPMSS